MSRLRIPCLAVFVALLVGCPAPSGAAGGGQAGANDPKATRATPSPRGTSAPTPASVKPSGASTPSPGAKAGLTKLIDCGRIAPAFDSDGDGNWSLAEFRAFQGKRYPQPGPCSGSNALRGLAQAGDRSVLATPVPVAPPVLPMIAACDKSGGSDAEYVLYDVGRDGKLDRADICAMVTDMASKVGMADTLAPLSLIDCHEAFGRFDADGDRGIGVDELTKLMEELPVGGDGGPCLAATPRTTLPEGERRIPPTRARCPAGDLPGLLLKSGDQDGDGKLSEAEFCPLYPFTPAK